MATVPCNTISSYPRIRGRSDYGKKMGFHIVGTLPKAFKNLELGFIDAYVMYKELAT